MKREKLQDAVGMVGDDLINEAANYKKKRKALRLIPLVAALLCITILAGMIALRPNEESLTDTEENHHEAADVNESITPEFNFEYCVSQAVYPERVQNYHLTEDIYDPNAYDKWQEDRDSYRKDYNSLSPDISRFITYSTKAFLADTEDNAVYSPVNVYMALAMLAEISGGESRNQILEALGSDSIESLRSEANAVWKALYTNDGTAKTILANSMWLRDDTVYKEDTLDILSRNYYASSFSGRMGSSDYDKALQSWIDSQTDNMLTDQTKGLSMPEETVLSLVSTVLFNAKWSDEFNPERNTSEVFNGTNGKVTTEFMNDSTNGSVDVGDNFMAYKKYFTDTGFMTFILPKEGMSPQELIATDEFSEYLNCGGRDSYSTDYTDKPCWQTQRHAIINLSIPKFDISSQLDLTKDLGKLGITDITNEIKADTSPLSDVPAFLDTMIHGARVTVDEKGCKAAAFTMMLDGATSAPLDEIDFILDRPFVFIIGGYDGLPLFVGTVNNIN